MFESKQTNPIHELHSERMKKIEGKMPSEIARFLKKFSHSFPRTKQSGGKLQTKNEYLNDC